MTPRTARAAAAAAKPPVRMAILFSPNGVIPDAWTPAEIGANFTLVADLGAAGPRSRAKSSC